MVGARASFAVTQHPIERTFCCATKCDLLTISIQSNKIKTFDLLLLIFVTRRRSLHSVRRTYSVLDVTVAGNKKCTDYVCERC